jgi:hypothetical protein
MLTTRPRSRSGEPSWRIEFAFDVQRLKQPPVMNRSTVQGHTDSKGAMASIATLKPPVPATKAFQLARPSAAERSAPPSAPAPKAAERMPNTSGPALSVSEARMGRMTWKLKPTVLTTVTSVSTRRACGEWRT